MQYSTILSVTFIWLGSISVTTSAPFHGIIPPAPHTTAASLSATNSLHRNNTSPNLLIPLKPSSSGVQPGTSTCTIYLSNMPCSDFTKSHSSASRSGFLCHSFTWTIPNSPVDRARQLPSCKAFNPSVDPISATTVLIRAGECNMLPPSHDEDQKAKRSLLVSDHGDIGPDGIPDGIGGFNLIGAFENEKCIVTKSARVLTASSVNQEYRNSSPVFNLRMATGKRMQTSSSQAASRYRVKSLWDLMSGVAARQNENVEVSARHYDGIDQGWDRVSSGGGDDAHYGCWDTGLKAQSFVVVGYGQTLWQ